MWTSGEAARMECELKYALAGESEYLKLQQSLGPLQARLLQTNLYWGSQRPESEAASGALRLRLERNLDTGDETRWLTYKQRATPSHFVPTAYFVAHEYETTVSLEDWEQIASGTPSDLQWQLEPLSRFAELNGRTPLHRVGELENLRCTYPLPDGSLAELDRTRFPGNREDFELEVETDRPEQVESWLRNHFQQLGIELRAQALTKYRRFLDQLNG